MKAVFIICTDDLKANALDKMRRPEGLSYPIKGSEDERLMRILKRVLAET